MTARRVAVLADLHGNAVALAPAPGELERERADPTVHWGDLTRGLLPAATAVLLDGRGALPVCGNAARLVVEASGDPQAYEMIETLRHPPIPAEMIVHAEPFAFSA